MGEHARTAEARRVRIQAACTSIVAALDGHVDTLTTEDAIKSLGFVIATYALAWGQPKEVITAIGQIAWDTTQDIQATKAKAAAAETAKREAEQAEPVEVWGDDPWERSDWEPIRNDRTIAAAQTVTRVYEFDCVGGNLHVTIDDENVNDGCLEGDADWIERSDGHGMKQQDPARYARQQDAERACVAALRPLSEEERMSAIRIACRS